MANNLTKPSNHNRYSNLVKEFAFVLSILGGRQAYEFIRINLPGGLPSLQKLSSFFNEEREQLVEGEFRFDSMKAHLKSMNVSYAFVAEDCTGAVQKVCYDRQSNSFVGFCPPLQNDGFPRVLSFNIESFYELEKAFETKPLSSLLNVHAIQPIAGHGQYSSPFLLAAYGSNNKFDTYHVISRWLKIFDESLQRGIRLVGSRLTAMRDTYARCVLLRVSLRPFQTSICVSVQTYSMLLYSATGVGSFSTLHSYLLSSR